MLDLSSQRTMLVLMTAGAAFALVLSVYLIGLMLWSGRNARKAERIELRLGLKNAPASEGRVLRLWREGEEATTTVHGEKPGRGVLQGVEELCREAGWETQVHTALLLLIGVTVLVFCIVWLLGNSLLFAVCAAFVTLAGFRFYLLHRVDRTRRLFENQLIDALELAARSLRVGHPITGAFRLISEEVAAPVGPVFGAIVQQQQLGLSLDEAIRKAADASTSDDLKLLATSVVIQLRSGGNLADMMERVAFVMRDRLRLVRRVRVLTTQTQFSKQVLLAMPFLVFVVLNLMNATYMLPLYTTSGGRLILIIAGAMLAVGAYAMNRLAIIRY